jgi:hypothetical protein
VIKALVTSRVYGRQVYLSLFSREGPINILTGSHAGRAAPPPTRTRKQQSTSVREFTLRNSRDDLIRGVEQAPGEHAEAVLATYSVFDLNVQVESTCSFGRPARVREKSVHRPMNPPNQSRAVVMVGRTGCYSK